MTTLRYGVFTQADSDLGVARIKPSALRMALTDGLAIALLDPREEGTFSKNHLLLAVNLPLSKLELRIEELVPRKTTRIVLSDGGEGLSERTAFRLQKLGYRNVSVLEGGLHAWKAAGYEVFSGVNVPSKAFGEYVEHYFGTPCITPEELQAKIAAREDLIVLDSRPLDEYARMNIPGSIDVPGAELVFRFGSLPIRPETLVVVNCTGRTRSIVGTQSLINTGVKNRVVALRGGTMAWELAGFQCEHGARRIAPYPSDQARKWAREAAAKVAERYEVRMIDTRKLNTYEMEHDQRALYLFDVRTPEEYLAGHLPGSILAPGGELLQATDKYIGTRNARVILIDDQLVRAQMTASWLLQAGSHDVCVLTDPFSGKKLEKGVPYRATPGMDFQLPHIQLEALQKEIKLGEATVIDFASSRSYQEGHIPGAWFAIRARLEECLKNIKDPRHLVATGDDPNLTLLAAEDLVRLSSKPVSILEGGNKAWSNARLPLRKGLEQLATEADDIWVRPYDRTTGIKKAMKEYLDWEEALLEQVKRDGTLLLGPEGTNNGHGNWIYSFC